MASSSNKKLSIFYVLKVLEKYSDENHPLTQEDIVEKIYSIYGMECERKSIGASLDGLEELGYDIVRLPRKGCFLGERAFEKSEISYLVNAVFASRTIPSGQARKLAEKISASLSIYDSKKYKYIFKADEVSRSDNKQLFYTIDIINQAIELGKKVRFKYNKYVQNNQIEARNNGKMYLVNPYFMINSQGKYYLVCNYDYFDSLSNYRVEMITDIEIVDKDIKPIKEIKGCEKGIDIASYANENIYMFGGEHVDACLKLQDQNAVNYVVDWFGRNARIYKKDNVFYTDVKANEQALIYWALQYGEVVEVLEPMSTRDKIKEIVNKLVKKY